MVNTSTLMRPRLWPNQPTKSAGGDLVDKRTAWRELLILVTVPLAINFVFSPKLRNKLWQSTRELWGGHDHDHAGFVVRTIECRRVFTKYEATIDEKNRRNSLLQRAVLMYVARLTDLQDCDMMIELHEKAVEDLQQVEDLRVNNKTTDDDDDYVHPWDREEDIPEFDAPEMRRLRVARAVRPDCWFEVQPGIRLLLHIDANDEEPDDAPQSIYKETLKVVNITLTLKSNLSNGLQAIDKLVHDAFEEFQKIELTKTINDSARYMYVQLPSTTNTSATTPPSSEAEQDAAKIAPPTIEYQRFALGNEKSFKNIFFDKKEWLLRLVDQFTTRTGMFAVKGFPYKLGLLLHGPPGTGKTSIIKALAHYTKRHVVAVSLSKIRTNQQLMNEMFDLRFQVRGMEMPTRLEFKDVVFVMEDVDCAVNVVRTREDSLKEQEDNDPLGLLHKKDPDALTLAGLLNVLDGVIDSPGRIVIMTTNHPEMLDSALIRPGRINKSLLLGYMPPEQIRLMVEYYFQTSLSRDQRGRLDAIGREVTPAEVEELCAEHTSIESLLAHLECQE